MARTSLTLRNIQFRKKLRTEVNSHKTTLDAAEAATASNSQKVLVFTGKNGAGVCTLTGATVGDIVVGSVNLTDATDDKALFEGAITVVDQIQQSSASNLSAKKFLAVLRKPVS
jgi:hypothetical protein